MLQIALIFILLSLVMYLGYKAKRHTPGPGKVKKVFIQAGSMASTALAVVVFISLSVLWVAKDEIVTLDKVYWL